MYAEAIETARFLATEPAASVQTGRTPHSLVLRANKSSLFYFAPAVVKHAPVFISMPLINTWTVFDLLPGRSVVEALVGAGVPVYLLDWGRPGPEDQENPMSYYVDTMLGRMIQRACRHAGVQQIDAIGYCVGGTFLAAHIARNQSGADSRVRRVAFLATPIDFHVSGRLSTWAKPENFPLDAIVDGFGNFPRSLMKDSFAWLRPAGMISKWRSLHDRIGDAGFRDLWSAMEQWNGDSVDFPGETYREYVRSCYFDNRLITGGWMMDGRPVDLSAATMPALVLAAADDHIVPPPAAFALATRWGGPVQTSTLRGGHVAVCVTKELPRALLDWIRAA